MGDRSIFKRSGRRFAWRKRAKTKGRLKNRELSLAASGPEPLTAAHDLAQFCCGKPSLDRWLKTRALSNQEKGFTAVIVVHEASRVVGYYGLAPTAILPSTLPRSIRAAPPPTPV